MADYVNSFGPVEIIGTGQLSERFVRVRMEPVIGYIVGSPAEYIVWF
ncbi:hypothetical protein [Sinorhizobium fredii]